MYNPIKHVWNRAGILIDYVAKPWDIISCRYGVQDINNVKSAKQVLVVIGLTIGMLTLCFGWAGIGIAVYQYSEHIPAPAKFMLLLVVAFWVMSVVSATVRENAK